MSDTALATHIDPIAAPALSSSTGFPTRMALGLLLVAYFLTATAYNLAVPVGEAPDEPDHVRYVEILLRTGQLPTIPTDSPRYSYEAEQPPLYYLLQAGWMRLLWPSDALLPPLHANPDFSANSLAVPNQHLRDYPPGDAIPTHLMRLLSTLLGVCTLWLVWLSARSIWPEDKGSALAAVGFAALIPGFTFTSGTVTNDALAATMGAAVIFFLLRILRRGVSLQSIALAGLALGLGVLAKRSLLVGLPLLAIVPLVSPARNRWARLAGGVGGCILALAVGAWPFVANMLTYGDPFATTATMQVKSDLTSPLDGRPGYWLSPGYYIALFNSFWGSFGLRHIDLPTILYAFYYCVCAVAVIGVVRHWRGMSPFERRALLLLVGALLLINAGVAYQNTQFWAVQGRLLLPSLSAVVLLVGRGLSLAGKQALPNLRSRQAALGALLATMLVFNWYTLIHYIILFYRR